MNKKKLLALVLAAVMLLGLLPMGALAAEDSGGEDERTVPLSSIVTANNDIDLSIRTGFIDGTPINIRLYDNAGIEIQLENVSDPYVSQSVDCWAKYTASVQPGTYKYSAFDSNGIFLGGGEFFVSDNNGYQEIYLTHIRFDGAITNKDKIPFQLTITSSDGGTSFPIGENGMSAILPPVTGEHDEAYIYSFIPEDDAYWGSKGKLWVYQMNSSYSFTPLQRTDYTMGGFLISPKMTLQIQVESGADIRVYRRTRMFTTPESIEGVFVSSEAGKDTYEFSIPTGINLHYEARKEGKITQAKQFIFDKPAQNAVMEVPPLKANSQTVFYDETQGPYEASILLNGPASKMLSLQVGESFDIVASRAWQAVDSTVGNYYVNPDFHYELASGNSVHLRDDGRITAVSPGISVIRVTYDALEYNASESAYKDENGLMLYSAIWPERTGVLVICVNATNTSNIQTNIDLGEFDTVYYTASINGEERESFALYTFFPTADADINVRVQKPLTDNWDSNWENGAKNDDGSYTVKLYQGPNIVEVSSQDEAVYHVIFAQGLDITIRKKGAGIADNDHPLMTGDTAQISFNGLLMTIPKVGAVYNPGYPATTHLQYELDGTIVESQHTQWFVRTENTIEIPLDYAGVYTLKDGAIYTTVLGHTPGYHDELTKQSILNNAGYSELADESFNGFNSKLPSFSFSVTGDKSEEDLKQQALDYIQVLTSTSATAATSWKTGNPNFGKNSNFGIACKVNSWTKEANTPTIPTDNQDFPQNFVFWGNNLLNTSEGKVYVKVKPEHADDLTMKVRYWSDGSTVRTMDLPSNTSTATEAFASTSHAAFLEVIISPKDGVNAYTKTYTVLANHTSSSDYGKLAYLYGLELTALDGQENMSVLDGLLHADAVDGIDFGYGFLGTETGYTASVPYETTKITLKPTALVEGDAIVTITVAGEMVDNKTASQEISLAAGVNTIPVIVTVSDGTTVQDTRTYTLKIERRAPKTVSFDLPEGAAVVVKQNNKTFFANDDGTYSLYNGEYTCYVSKPKYETKVTDFTVAGDQPTMTVAVTELVPIPEQSGSVTVRIAGQDAVLVPEEEVTISDDPADLAKLRYVRYNHGGYTVLHALLEACDPAAFNCSKGEFIPEIAIDETGLGANAGWVCEVNGVLCADPANTLAADGDRIDFYYSSDYADMLHARFAEEAISITEGSGTELILIGTPIGGGTKAPIADADIYLGKELVGITDDEGKITIPAEKLAEKRNYFVTAEKKNDAGQNILTFALAIITVEKDEDKAPANPGYTTVSFRLIGDTKHGDETQYHAYSTWIGTTAYAFDSEKVSVGDVFQRALTEAELAFVGLNYNYIESIVGPDGNLLEEFSNGQNSGWMFTVNGIHSGQGLNNIYVTDGDEIVWHYVDDYVQETMDNYNGTTGSTSIWNTWLDAADGPSINAGVILAVTGAEIEQTGATYTATLPYGSELPTAEQISIVPEDAAATVTTPLTETGEASWSFSVTAENGNKKDYTLNVVISAKTAEQTLAEAKAAIEAADWSTEQQTANDAAALKTFVEGKLAAMDLGGADYVVTISEGLSPAVAGTEANIPGTAGSYGFTAELALNEAAMTAEVTDAVISATAYLPPVQDVPYKTALNGVTQYLKEQVPDPKVASIYGEWAVFALNRGGVAEGEWNQKYFENLKAEVQRLDGVLHDRKYTEYSRVVLALTSAGVDATQVTTDTKTYDLVTPLLDKQDNGAYWAEWQGNNGTAFALLALDSHDYLNTAEGKAARAGYIASLKANQLGSGAWSINSTAPDLDTTAAVVYALAPYYLDEARLSALGGSVSYAEVKTMVDSALNYLSNAQSATGGFGSAEADVWVLIALSSLGRDADMDEAFVKAEGSLLNDLLRYYDAASGGFQNEDENTHALSLNQMSSEQAAYGLVAYDRFKNEQNTLYDMSDVTILSLADREDHIAAEAVDALVAAIGEVTLESESAITAARDAYDALTDEQKSFVEKLTVLTDAEAKLDELKAAATQEEIDKAAAKTVEDQIAAIGEVTLESESAITGARAAYNDLTEAQKALVTNLAVLAAAEAKLAELKDETSSGGSSGGGEDDEKKIRVTMRLIGAELAEKEVDLGAEEAYLPNYVTWIATTAYELEEGATVYDLWVKATGEAGIRSIGAEDDYVETVYAPSGYELSEFTNGNRSGWMYTVNGSHPGRGLTDWTLYDGDTVIWHYVNDYSYEVADWTNDGQWQALGDGTYYNQWLKAPDYVGGAGGGVSGSSSGGSGSGSSGSDSSSGTTVTSETDEVALTAEEVRSAAETGEALTVETENGSVTLSPDALDALASEEKNVTVSVVTGEDGTTTVNVTVDGEAADVTVKAALPATGDGQVLVIVNADGTEEVIKKSVVEDGTAYAELPAGATVKAVDNSKDFGDVSENAWYAAAVDFVSSHELFEGVDEGVFAPEDNMTRAMLVTVLFRLENEPEGFTGVKFVDVKDDTWYTDAVAWASENDIVNGNGDGFAPNDNITREQIATVLYRYARYLGLDVSAKGDVSSFGDGSEVSSWASDAMAWAVEVGLFEGDDAGNLNPKADATRAQVATLIERMVKLIVK